MPTSPNSWSACTQTTDCASPAMASNGVSPASSARWACSAPRKDPPDAACRRDAPPARGMRTREAARRAPRMEITRARRPSPQPPTAMTTNCAPSRRRPGSRSTNARRRGLAPFPHMPHAARSSVPPTCRSSVPSSSPMLAARRRSGSGCAARAARARCAVSTGRGRGIGGRALLDRLLLMRFRLDEEAGLTVADVAARVREALDHETPYGRFRRALPQADRDAAPSRRRRTRAAAARRRGQRGTRQRVARIAPPLGRPHRPHRARGRWPVGRGDPHPPPGRRARDRCRRGQPRRGRGAGPSTRSARASRTTVRATPPSSRRSPWSYPMTCGAISRRWPNESATPNSATASSRRARTAFRPPAGPNVAGCAETPSPSPT